MWLSFSRRSFVAILMAVVSIWRMAQFSFLASKQHTKAMDGPVKPQRHIALVQQESKVNRTCLQNPYLPSLSDSIELVTKKADHWLSVTMDLELKRANEPLYRKQNHERFYPFAPIANCSPMTCVGGECGQDESKNMCGLQELKKGCIIYSIGGNNLWSFELDLLIRTPCEIHTFDCTGDISRFQKPDNPRLHFHHICLGKEFAPAKPVLDPEGKCILKHLNAKGIVTKIQKCGETWTLLEMQRRLGHSRIDLFKMDIEGWEWPLFQSWPELDDVVSSSQVLLPMQIMVEIHYRTKFPELLGDHPNNREFKFAEDMIYLNQHFMKMGFVVVARDNNRFCPHCTELTLVRIRCPDDGVYAPYV